MYFLKFSIWAIVLRTNPENCVYSFLIFMSLISFPFLIALGGLPGQYQMEVITRYIFSLLDFKRNISSFSSVVLPRFSIASFYQVKKSALVQPSADGLSAPNSPFIACLAIMGLDLIDISSSSTLSLEGVE